MFHGLTRVSDRPDSASGRQVTGKPLIFRRNQPHAGYEPKTLTSENLLYQNTRLGIVLVAAMLLVSWFFNSLFSGPKQGTQTSS